MAFTIEGRVLRMAAAADTAAGEYTVQTMLLVSAADTTAWAVKDAAGNLIWAGTVLVASTNYQITFPLGLRVTGIEFDDVPTGAILYVYLV